MAGTKENWKEGVDRDLLELFDEIEACQFKFDPLVAQLGGFRQKLMDQKTELIVIARNGGGPISKEGIRSLFLDISRELPKILDKASAIKDRLGVILAK